ncbi:hypothetical protein [Chryseobacterium indoltheticum]|uniref:Uncharacterized protein n=1 Tax=Chryseobacterium indoltheticum TaxID=254 RepID=A0A381F6G5_9FLAO|nr:hypothetical protein [Chryseobacterium indoltheticum]QQQ27046.1 hypothetical protein JJL46_13055 [Chryseobacterium indoltheticum]SIQ75824.1 hypothetical protein SAMN05421682_10843 [Chryseobacterium indoltheticum]SUX42161.1 Uncharacterised protein [Chryseobacterium indoltheticum]
MDSSILKFSIVYIVFFVIEVFISYIFLLVEESFNISSTIDAVSLWNFWRLLFYGVPFLILYFFLFKYFKNLKIYKPLLFSIFNLLVYILLTFLSRIIFGKNIPLSPEGIMFWITCLSILLAPIVLGFIPYFRGLMNKI